MGVADSRVTAANLLGPALNGGVTASLLTSFGTSPAFTGVPTAPTATGGTNTTQLATTAFVTAAVAGVGAGTVTSISGSGGTTGLTLAGGPITTSGTLTLGGTLAVANGGTGSTTGAAAQTALGATTTGSSFFGLTNPSAVTFPRINADNSVTALSASAFRTAIGAGTGGGDALTANPLSQFAATTSAQLAGVLSDETGTGVAVFNNGATLIAPALGTPVSGVLTNCTGTASGLTAGTVTTIPNLTGDVTSVGNATTLTNAPVIAKVLTGYSLGAGTVASTDSILQAIQKLDGNDGLKAALAGANTFTGVNTFTPAARSSGSASYLTVTMPADTGITTATESIGVNFTAAARTFVDGTIALQRERFYGAPTYNKTTTSATITDVFNSYFATPVAGAGMTFTRQHAVGIVGATAATSSITGELIIATTLGTSATSVGIGGGVVACGTKLITPLIVFPDSFSAPVITGSSSTSGLYFNGTESGILASNTSMFTITGNGVFCNTGAGLNLVNGDTHSVALNVKITTPASQFINVISGAAKTNPITLRIFNTSTTDPTNNTLTSASAEWFEINWSVASNVCTMGTQQGVAGGTARNIVMERGGVTQFTLSALAMTFADAYSIAGGTTTGTQLMTATTQKLGLWGVTPVVQPAGAGQASITDSTGGLAASSLVDVTTAAVADPVKCNANFASINVLLLAIRAALVASGNMKGAA